MAIDSVSGAVGLATAGVRGSNDQTRAFGAGVSQLLNSAAGTQGNAQTQTAVQPVQEAATGSQDQSATSGPPSADPDRGTRVDIFA